MLEIVPGAEGIRQCHDSAKIRSRQQGLEVTTGGRSQWVPVMWPVTDKETDSEKQAKLLLAISNPLAHGLSPPSWQSDRVTLQNSVLSLLLPKFDGFIGLCFLFYSTKNENLLDL